MVFENKAEFPGIGLLYLAIGRNNAVSRGELRSVRGSVVDLARSMQGQSHV
jgi:hypothetical protein